MIARLVLLLLMLLTQLAHQALAQDTAAVAEIVALDGQVEHYSSNTAQWTVANPGQWLYPGDALRTGEPGRVQISSNDGSQIHLNRNSRLVFREVAQTAGWVQTVYRGLRQSLYELLAWREDKVAEMVLENNDGGATIELLTPTVKAGIRGTRVVLSVEPSAGAETSVLRVLDGSVDVTGVTVSGDSLVAESGYQVTARRGQPLKLERLTVSPRDAVQWTLHVPPLRLTDTASLSAADRSVSSLLEDADRQIRAGTLEESLATLDQALEAEPDSATAYRMRSTVLLVQDQKPQALASAQRAVALAPDSALAALALSDVYRAQFDLPAAQRETLRALSLQPDNVQALTSLARLQFGDDDLQGGWETMQTALSIAPANAEVQNLLGFLLLARNETAAAVTAFQQSIKLDSHLGEPHLGLALAYMRQGRDEQALRAISTAALLDPQRSLIRSYWGKMLYQLRNFDKALRVLEQARALDPNDPTPDFYRAIILRDLNRPGAAIRAFNRAVALNDNRAVYRSRFLLDQDLASRNVDLAILYNQLGLNSWAKSKALTSIKYDYGNFDGHLFYAGTLFALEGRSYSAQSEALLARLLQPANVNTFNNFNNYTALFEQPATNATLQGQLGNHQTYGASATIFGAVPDHNLAFQAGALYDDTNGWRDTNLEREKSAAGLLNWQPTVKDGFFFSASRTSSRQDGSPFPRFEYDAPEQPLDRRDGRVTRFEAGYHRRLGQSSDLLLYATYLDSDIDTREVEPLPPLPNGIVGAIERNVDAKRPFFQGQLHYTVRAADHQIIAGSLQYRGHFEAQDRTELVLSAAGSTQRTPIPFLDSDHDPDTGFQSYYLQDIWRISESLTLEAGAYYDRIDNANPFEGTEWTVEGFDPRLGLIFQPDAKNTLRFASGRFLMPFLSPRLDPTEVAGLQVFRDTLAGTRSTEVAAAWEHQWRADIFTALTGRYSDRSFEEVRVGFAGENRRTLHGRISEIGLEYNQLLGERFGLLGAYRYLSVNDDEQYLQGLDNTNRSEHLLRLGIRYVHPDGFSAGLQQSLRLINNDNVRDDETAPVTDIHLGYELPRKQGSVRLDVLNVFDRKFNWATDRFALRGRVPRRQLLFTFSWNL